MNAFKWAGLLSIIVSLLNITVFNLGADFYHLVGISTAELAKLNLSLSSELPERWLLFSATAHGLFSLYVFSAASLFPRLPLLRAFITLLTLFYIVITFDYLMLPFTSSIEGIYQSWFVWLMLTLLQLALTLCSIYGLRQSWRQLSYEANSSESLLIITGLIIGLFMTFNYESEIYMNWTLTLINEYKVQLSLLPENIDYIIISVWIALPKILLLSLFSALFISKLGQQRRFLYAVLIRFLFFTYILRTLPFLSIILTVMPDMANIKIASDNLNLILFLLTFSITLTCLNKANNRN